MAEIAPAEPWSLEHVVTAATAGIRLVFTGAAGGLGYSVMTGDLTVELEFGLLFLLVGMVAALELGLQAVEYAIRE